MYQEEAHAVPACIESVSFMPHKLTLVIINKNKSKELQINFENKTPHKLTLVMINKNKSKELKINAKTNHNNVDNIVETVHP